MHFAPVGLKLQQKYVDVIREDDWKLDSPLLHTSLVCSTTSKAHQKNSNLKCNFVLGPLGLTGNDLHEIAH